jgi:Ca2+-binding EF-hand superfamily protein
MLREFAFLTALALPAVATAQQPCTPDARRVVDELYQRVLERPAGRDGDVVVQRLAAGDRSVRDIVRQLALSREYMQRFVRTGSETERRASAAAFYRHLLGREAEPGGLQAHTEGLRTTSVDAVVDAFLNSDEYREQFGDDRVPGTQVRYCGAAAIDTSNRVPARFRNMDSNRDGRITRAEWRGTAWAFASDDLNGDGVLTVDEMRRNSGNGAVGTTGQVDDNDATARFTAMDTNRNGRIERREWTGTAAEFDRIDANQNNLLSPAEVSAGTTAESDSFESLDVNRDGRVTIQEWNWNRRSFQQQDTNGDGVITRREFRGVPGVRNGF